MPVASILTYLSGGMTVDEMLKEFNWLTIEDIHEVLAFATLNFKLLPRRPLLQLP